MVGVVESVATSLSLDPRYFILHQIGVGGMGIVYSARDRLTNEMVALKSITRMQTLSSKNSTQLDLDQRVILAKEFQTLASLQHPNIISVIDYGFDSHKQPYFTMDLLQHPSTILQVAKQTPTLVGKIELIAQLLHAVSYLHRRGILHRDLKPGNILVQDSQVKLLDFGLAALKQQDDDDTVVGTPAYFAPEVVLGAPTTIASDLYAVGVVMYEIFAGHLPFRAASVEKLIDCILYQQPDMSAFSVYPENETHIPDSSDAANHTLIFGIPGLDATQTMMISAPDKGEGTLPQYFTTSDGSHTEDRAHPIAVKDVVERLLYKDPTLRYQSADEVIYALEAVVGKRLMVETSATRESFLQSAPFIGREEELDQLWDALQQALEGAGSTWLVHGESGIGKARLLAELRIRALVNGITVFRSRASEMDAPYQVWRDILRRLLLHSDVDDYEASVLKTIVPNVGTLIGRPVREAPALSPDQANKRLVSVITGLFAKQTQPMLILLEGLHHVHSETLILLERLSRIAPKQKLLIVGSYRSDESIGLSPLLHALPRIHLRRFTGDEIFQLTKAMIGDAADNPKLQEFLKRETEGNVRFIIDVLRALAEQAGRLGNIGSIDLPTHLTVEGIQYLFQRRLSRVASQDYPLLCVAALVGRELDLKILRNADTAVQLEAWLLDCSEAAVIEMNQERWEFSHEKLRQEILQQLSSENEKLYAERAAKAIEQAYTDRKDFAPLLIRLWAKAHNPQKERYYRLLAAEQSYQAETYSHAISYLRHPYQPEPNSVESNLIEQNTLIHLAKCEMQIHHYDEAIKLAEDALNSKNILDNDGLRAEAMLILGCSRFYQGDLQEAAESLKQSMILYSQSDNFSGIGESLCELARISSAQGDYATAGRYLESSLQTSKQAGDLWQVAKTYSDLGYVAMMQNNFAAAEEYLEQGLTISHSINYRAGVAAVLMLLGIVSHFRNKTPQSVEYFLESLSISREIGDQKAEADTLHNLGSYAILRQDYDDAERWLTQSLGIYDSLNFRLGVAATLVKLGYAALGTGYTAIARQYFRESLSEAKELQAIPLELEAIIGLARITAHQGNIAQALEWVSVVLNHPSANPDVKSMAQRLFAELYSLLPPSEVDTHLSSGRKMDIDALIISVLTLFSGSPHDQKTESR